MKISDLIGYLEERLRDNGDLDIGVHDTATGGIFARLISTSRSPSSVSRARTSRCWRSARTGRGRIRDAIFILEL